MILIKPVLSNIILIKPVLSNQLDTSQFFIHLICDHIPGHTMSVATT